MIGTRYIHLNTTNMHRQGENSSRIAVILCRKDLGQREKLQIGSSHNFQLGTKIETQRESIKMLTLQELVHVGA